MDVLFPFFGPISLIAALFIAFCAGFVKGVVGFALPLILISGLTLFISPELALAGLILPTLAANAVQSLRQGPQAAWEAMKDFRYFLVAGGIALVIAAQMVRVVPEYVLLFAIGVPTFGYAALQLGGMPIALGRYRRWVETLFGGVAGVMGGFAGVWGPPTVVYLTAMSTPKNVQMRVQGVIYGMGSLLLVLAHLGSGVLRTETIPLSFLLVPPALLGMWAGGKVSDRIDQARFKQATLIVLLIAGANLIRRAVL